MKLSAALQKSVESTTKKWSAQKKKKKRMERVSRRELESYYRVRRVSIKDAAFEVMERAYNHASSNGRYAATARQIMYAARPLVMEITGGKIWSKSDYFTQALLNDYIEEYSPDWNVIFDARGKLVEPHTTNKVELGTLAVRRYISGWSDKVAKCYFDVRAQESKGPALRYRYALFIEKEGFQEILEEARIAERYDLAIMSTKGMSTTAARELVDELSGAGCTVLVARDFDKAGFSIVETLRSSNRRYRFSAPPKVFDLGLRLQDVREMNLQDEAFGYGKSDPRRNLSDNGATEEEIEFLVSERGWSYSGRRVELNAMTSEQLIVWLERKFEQHGVEKLIPDDDALRKAYLQAVRKARFRKEIERIEAELKDADQGETVEVPDDLRELVRKELENSRSIPWDQAVEGIAAKRETEEDDSF